jgi:hypothetical protein
MKTEQQRLVWHFIGCFAGIVATVGVAILMARWTGPIG